MLSEEQKSKIEQLSRVHAHLLKDFPKWDPTIDRIVPFPDSEDLKAIAEKVDTFSYALGNQEQAKNIKYFVKYIFVSYIQPIARVIFKRQMLFNEHMWLLANTVAAQNQKIKQMEKRLNELEKQNSN